MKTLEWMVLGLAGGMLVAGIREIRRRRAHGGYIFIAEFEEPVLGYDGMDQETLMEWLEDAWLNEEQLETILEYEDATLCREPVLALVDELMGRR